MAKKVAVPPAYELPADLVAFLETRKQLEYDPSTCDAGAVRLVPLSRIKAKRFPMETGGESFYNKDPNAPGRNSYLVLAVDLIAKCNHNYSPAGLLMWLPIEQRYAAWDSDHCTIDVFPKRVTWKKIAANPVMYIEASLGGEVPGMTRLIPWLAHPYGKKQVYKPQRA